VQKIFQAMKTYGLIVADRGSNMFVQGTMDPRWDNTVLNPAFHELHVTTSTWSSAAGTVRHDDPTTAATGEQRGPGPPVRHDGARHALRARRQLGGT
jgi:hypothetical protein